MTRKHENKIYTKCTFLPKYILNIIVQSINSVSIFVYILKYSILKTLRKGEKTTFCGLVGEGSTLSLQKKWTYKKILHVRLPPVAPLPPPPYGVICAIFFLLNCLRFRSYGVIMWKNYDKRTHFVFGILKYIGGTNEWLVIVFSKNMQTVHDFITNNKLDKLTRTICIYYSIRRQSIQAGVGPLRAEYSGGHSYWAPVFPRIFLSKTVRNS